MAHIPTPFGEQIHGCCSLISPKSTSPQNTWTETPGNVFEVAFLGKSLTEACGRGALGEHNPCVFTQNKKSTPLPTQKKDFNTWKVYI